MSLNRRCAIAKAYLRAEASSVLLVFGATSQAIRMIAASNRFDIETARKGLDHFFTRAKSNLEDAVLEQLAYEILVCEIRMRGLNFNQTLNKTVERAARLTGVELNEMIEFLGNLIEDAIRANLCDTKRLAQNVEGREQEPQRQMAAENPTD